MNPLHIFDNPRLLLGTLAVRFFGLAKIPMLAFVRPTIEEWSHERVTFRIPLGRRTRNHLGSMYFGALAAGADLAAGFLAMEEIKKSGKKVSLIFKDMQARFLKRAHDDVLFTCDEGVLVRDLVAKAIETGERVELPVLVTATAKGDDTEPVAEFTLTLSLKLKEDKEATGNTSAQDERSPHG